MVYAGLERHEFVIPVLELHKINEFIVSLYGDLGLTAIPLRRRSLEGPFVRAVHTCLNDGAGIPDPSLFKICAAVTIGFMQCPLVGPAFPDCRISGLPKHQNAYVIFAYCRRALHGATIYPNGKARKLHNPINVSGHLLYDLIDMLGDAKPSPHFFNLLALLYEVLVYQTNPKIQNSLVFPASVVKLGSSV